MCHEQWALTVIKLLRFFVLICGKSPRKDIAMKFGSGIDVLDVVTWAEFDLENLRGVNG